MQISGHRNISSINNYSHINNQQHQEISSILSTTVSSSSKNGSLVPSLVPRCSAYGSRVSRNNEIENMPPLPALPMLPAPVPATVSSSNTSLTSKTDHLQSIFGSSHIAGGSFSITINNFSSKRPKRPIIESDTDSN